MSNAQCPICRESIQAAALKCRFCGHVLVPDLWRAEYVEWKQNPAVYERERLPDFSDAQRSLFFTVVEILEGEKQQAVEATKAAPVKRSRSWILWVLGGLIALAVLPALMRNTSDAKLKPGPQGAGGVAGPAGGGSPGQVGQLVSMHAWAQEYRSSMEWLLQPTQYFATYSNSPRPICQMLKDSPALVLKRLRKSPDPAINDALQDVLNAYVEAGQACLDGQPEVRDICLLRAQISLAIVENRLRYTYQEPGVPGLAEALDAATDEKD